VVESFQPQKTFFLFAKQHWKKLHEQAKAVIFFHHLLTALYTLLLQLQYSIGAIQIKYDTVLALYDPPFAV